LDFSGGVGTREEEGEKTGGGGQLKEGHRGRRGVAGEQEGWKGGEGEKDEKSLPHGYF